LSGEIVTAQFKLGNSSSVRKRVTVLLHDLDFSDLSACTFWLEPGQPLSDFGMRSYATRAWANATISIYAASVGDETWTRLDNVMLRKTPGGDTSGTNCVEPGVTLSPSGAPATQASKSQTVSLVQPTLERPPAPGNQEPAPPAGTADRAVSANDRQHFVVGPVDLLDREAARLTLNVRVSGDAYLLLRVWNDQDGWVTVLFQPADDKDTALDIDLTRWTGQQIVWIEFVVLTSDEGTRRQRDMLTSGSAFIK